MKTFKMVQLGETAVELTGGTAEMPWSVRVDVPGEGGGTGGGPKPAELLAMSLAACKAMAALQYGRRKGHKLRGITAEVGYEVAEHPRRISKIVVRFSGMKEQLDEEALARVEAAMRGCTISHSLKQPVEVETVVE